MSSGRMHILLLASAFGLWGAAAALAQPPAATVEELARQAYLVFQGTVERPGAVNVAAVQPAGDTAVVRIDAVFEGPPLLKEFAGREVTVKLTRPGSVQAGDKAVFFARGWLVGESLAVVEVGRVAPAAAVGPRVAAVRRTMAGEELMRRLDGAALVVAGRVVETRPRAAAEEGRKGRGGEHEPRWREAVLAVDRVLKGTPGDTAAPGRVVLLYPSNPELAWLDAPKPEAGWDGIWLLERRVVDGGEVYTALHPWNLMSRDTLAAVEGKVRP